MPEDYSTYSLGDFKLKEGGVIPNAEIAYKTFGDPSSPAIIYPSWYSGKIADNEWLVGEDKTLLVTKILRQAESRWNDRMDLYFPPEDSEIEVANMNEGIGECIPFLSIWGHWA